MRRIGLAVLNLLLCSSSLVSAQVSTTSSVPMSARVPGSISLSLRSTPVSIAVLGGAQTQFEVPFSVEWNLNPSETPGFRVVAYFHDSQAALTDMPSSTSVPTKDVMARWGDSLFRSFDEAGTSLTLFQTTVLPDLRRGQKSQTLQLKIADDALSSLPDGIYQGTLYLEVRNY